MMKYNLTPYVQQCNIVLLQFFLYLNTFLRKIKLKHKGLAIDLYNIKYMDR